MLQTSTRELGDAGKSLGEKVMELVSASEATRTAVAGHEQAITGQMSEVLVLKQQWAQDMQTRIAQTLWWP